jgi:16S rRNA (guanine527-N7)-methyltransferase
MDDLLKEGIRLQDSDGDELFGNRLDEVLNLLEKYIAEIELFNPAYKLVGVKDRRELVVKHILDSLSGLEIIRLYLNIGAISRIADAGSGAGLPGIPLAICLPYCSFTLIERTRRRAGFLRNTLAVLHLQNAVVEEKDIERADSARFNIITFRAFKPLEKETLQNLFRLLLPNGVLVAYKGRKEAIDREMAALDADFTIFPIQVPFLDEDRHIVVIKKE